jgi:hypothetical protein
MLGRYQKNPDIDH